MGHLCTKCGTTNAAQFYMRGNGDGAKPRSHCKACLRRTPTQRARRRALGAEKPMAHILENMIQRCHNPNNPSFVNYGGRGVKVCDRWRDVPGAFAEDMGERPSPAHSIERIDNNGPYSPENCRWATREEQNRNTRQNVNLTHQGETLCVAQWAARLGVPAALIRDRLRLGWDTARALSEPAHATRPKRRAA